MTRLKYKEVKVPGNPGKKMLTHEEFVRRSNLAHGENTFTYTSTFKGRTHPIDIHCNVCEHEFTITVSENHFYKRKTGCPKCTNKKYTKTHEQFLLEVNEIFGKDRYTYLTEYSGTEHPIDIHCNSCGNDFHLKKVKGHIHSQRGCPTCKSSKGEQKLRQLLPEEYIHEYPIKDLIGTGGNPLRFDFYNEMEMIAIEYNGEQHYKRANWNGKQTIEEQETQLIKQQTHDNMKRNYCKTHNIHLIEIKYTKYNTIYETLKEKNVL